MLRLISQDGLTFAFAERASAVNGEIVETCTSLPWGDNLQCTGTDQSPLHFTGKQRDTESGLDNFEARYDSSGLGRFASRDEPFAGWEQLDPQAFNLYSYARSNPLILADPDGRDYRLCVGNEVGVVTCVTYQNLSDLQNALQGTGATLQNGQIIVNVNGQNTVAGTYEDITGLQPDFLGNAVIGALGGGAVSAFRGFFEGLLGSAARGTAEGVISGETTGVSQTTFEDLLQGTVKDASGQSTKSGGFAQATKDFESLAGKAQNLGKVQVKELPDGGKAVLRNFSNDGRPILDYQSAGGGSKIAWIRYNQ